MVFFVVGLPGILVALLMATVGEPERRGTASGGEGFPLGEVLRFAARNWRVFATHFIGFALLAVPMWLGQRVAHGVLAGVSALLMLILWPPAVTLLLVIVVIQHDLIRRRAIADEYEQNRRAEHERRRAGLGSC